MIRALAAALLACTVACAAACTCFPGFGKGECAVILPEAYDATPASLMDAARDVAGGGAPCHRTLYDEFMSERFRDETGWSTFKLALWDEGDRILGCLHEAEIVETLRGRRDGRDTALVRVRCPEGEGDVLLVREDGGWRVDAFSDVQPVAEDDGGDDR